MINYLRRKMNSESGESMAEVLVAALIVELALIAAVSMILSAGRIIVRSKESYADYFARQNAVAQNSGYVKTEDKIIITSKAGSSDPEVSGAINVEVRAFSAEGSNKETYSYIYKETGP